MFNSYTNQDIYNYLQIELQHSSSFDKNYLDLCNLLINKGLNNKVDEETLKKFQDIFNWRIGSELPGFSLTLRLANNYLRAIKDKSGIYNVYPAINFPNYTNLLIDYCIENNVSVIEACKYYSDLLKTVILKKQDELNNSQINLYRGDLHYIVIRCKAIYDSIKEMSLRSDLSSEDLMTLNNSLNNTANRLASILNIMSNDISINSLSEITQSYDSPLNKYILSPEEYDKINDLYDSIISEEEILLPISKRIWNDYSQVNNSCLIHKLTGAIVPSDDMTKICTTYYSDNINEIVKYNGNTGYIYPIDLELIISVCDSDVGSWQCDKQEFISRGLPSSWQLNKSNIWYENPYQSKLMSPEFIESQLLEHGGFAEILISNTGRKIKPISAFYTSDATEKEIAEITNIAKQQGLDVKLLETKSNIKKAS